MNASPLETDYYQFTAMQAAFNAGRHEQMATFYMFYRKPPYPDFADFIVVAGMRELADYFLNWKFEAEHIEYLRQTGDFTEEFLHYLSEMKFDCTVEVMLDGTIAYPGTPILKITGKWIQAQLLETPILWSINYPSLIATNAALLCYYAKGKPIIDFGLRRAQGNGGAHVGSHAAYIGGVSATSNVQAAKDWGMKPSGTMMHSFVMAFDNEYDAFKAYAETYGEKSVFLVDSYNTLKSGVPNVIKVMKELGLTKCAIRLDSGDLFELAFMARIMLDIAGLTDTKIYASNDLDLHKVRELEYSGAKIDAYGIGTNLITGGSTSALGGVYKLCMLDGVPKIKLSDDVSKTTLAGNFSVGREYLLEDVPVGDFIYSYVRPSCPLTPLLFPMLTPVSDGNGDHYKARRFKSGNYDNEARDLVKKYIGYHMDARGGLDDDYSQIQYPVNVSQEVETLMCKLIDNLKGKM